MARDLTEDERIAQICCPRACAQAQIENWSQEQLDRLSQGNCMVRGKRRRHLPVWPSKVWTKAVSVTAQAVPPNASKSRWFCVMFCVRPSTGIVEVDEARGLVKYAKPVGVIASLIPMTNPAMTPPVTGVSSANARNAVIFSPHPRTAQTTWQMTEVMRACLPRRGCA